MGVFMCEHLLTHEQRFTSMQTSMHTRMLLCMYVHTHSLTQSTLTLQSWCTYVYTPSIHQPMGLDRMSCLLLCLLLCILYDKKSFLNIENRKSRLAQTLTALAAASLASFAAFAAFAATSLAALIIAAV